MTLYNRNPCSDLANTCGECVYGFTGQSGSSNSLCYNISELLPTSSVSAAVYRYRRPERRLSENCRTDQDCPVFQLCDTGNKICTQMLKQCRNNCSNNGVCVLLDIRSGLQLSPLNCSILNVDCHPLCNCMSGWFGSSCSYNSTALMAKSFSRLSLLNELLNLIHIQDLTTQNLKSWIISLQSITLLSDEMSLSAANMTNIIISESINAAQSLSLSYDILLPLFSVCNTVVQVIMANATTSFYKLSRNARYNILQEQLVQQRNLIAATFPSMVIGQQPLSFLYSQLRVLISASAGLTDSFDRLTLISPQTGIESFISYPPSVTIASNISNQGSKVATTLIPVTSFDVKTPLITNSIIVQRENIKYQRIQLTLQRRDQKVSFYKQNLSPQIFVTRCVKGKTASAKYLCDGGVFMTATCDGGFQGNIKSTCPYNLTYPYCNVFNSISLRNQNGFCPAINTTVNTVTCDCSVESNFMALYVNSVVKITSVSQTVVYIPEPVEGMRVPSTIAGTLYEYRFILGSILIAICMMILACVVAYFKSSAGTRKKSKRFNWRGLDIHRLSVSRNYDSYFDEDEHKEADNLPEIRPEASLRDLEVNSFSRTSTRLSLGRSSALEKLILRLKQLFPTPVQEEDKGDDVGDDASSYFSVSSVYGRVGGTGGVSFGIDVSIQTALKAAASPRTTTVLNISMDKHADPAASAAEDDENEDGFQMTPSYAHDDGEANRSQRENIIPILESGDNEENALVEEGAVYSLTDQEYQTAAEAQSDRTTPLPRSNPYLYQKSSPNFNRSPIGTSTHSSLFSRRRADLTPPHLSPIAMSSRPETPHSMSRTEPFSIELSPTLLPTTETSTANTPQAADLSQARSHPSPINAEEMELYRKGLILVPRRSPTPLSPSQRKRDHKSSLLTHPSD